MSTSWYSQTVWSLLEELRTQNVFLPARQVTQVATAISTCAVELEFFSETKNHRSRDLALGSGAYRD